jgi:hypothetical protein
LELVEGLERRGAVHVGRPAAHVDGDADGLEDLVAVGAVPDRGLRVEADAAVAPPGDADGECDQLLGLGIERAGFGCRLGEAGERLGDLGRSLAVGVDRL